MTPRSGCWRGVVGRLPPGDAVEVALNAEAAALSLPVELVRLAWEGGGEIGPLGLLPGVSVTRPAAAVGEAGRRVRRRRAPPPGSRGLGGAAEDPGGGGRTG